MIELNLNKLERGTHTAPVKVSRGGKTFYQQRRVGQKKKDSIGDMVLMGDLVTGYKSRIEFAEKHGWNSGRSQFYSRNISKGTKVHMVDGKIYALSDLGHDESGNLHIGTLEVNPDLRRQGYGTKTMKNIIQYTLKYKYKGISLVSITKDSDKFYKAMGMKKTGVDKRGLNEYFGDTKWMKKILTLI
jgi:N-acetylglutamate synthase-like GNAT family acetyltransferase